MTTPNGRRATPRAPLHVEERPDEFYAQLDPGISYAVRVLHAAGIPTCQSCEGGRGHAYVRPSIDMVDGRAFEAMEVLERNGITVRDVSSVWVVEDGVPTERVWRLTLRANLSDRAHERPMFLTGHLARECWDGDSG